MAKKFQGNTCSRCGSIERYSKSSRCVRCVQEYGRRYREENRDAILAGKRMYREENRDAIRKSNRKYHEENREKRMESNRRYREGNREKELERNRKYNGSIRGSFVRDMYQRRQLSIRRKEMLEHAYS